MAKGLISITDSGLKDIIQYLEKLGDDYDRILATSFEAQQQVILERIKVNWVSMVGGTPGGYVFDSVGKSTAFSKNDPHTIVGTVGVYHMDSVASNHGKTKKDLNAAQIAYWVNFGTSRLRSGARKARKGVYDDSQLVGVAAKPFIDNAFYATINEQQDAFKQVFNQQMDNLK